MSKRRIKVLVCGGRNYDDKQKVFETLDKLNDKYTVNLVIEGGAKGADSLARMYANEKWIQNCTYHANWEKHGKMAGPMRNFAMLNLSDPFCVVAFKGGRGTADMVELAKESNVNVWEITQ